jgi:hypothetical protein
MGIDLRIRIFIYLLNFGHDLFLASLGIDADGLLLASILNAQVDSVGRKLVHGALLLVGGRCIFDVFL